MINELKTMYEEYDKTAMEVRKKAPLFAGWLGLGSDPRKNPCHEAFYEKVQEWMKAFVAGAPSAEQAQEAAWFLLEEPFNHQGAEGYWFLYVCIGLIRELIPFMSREDCGALADRMNALYPRRDRMPVQQDTFKMLQKAGK